MSPLLVETYVDRSTHTGKSLVAADWLRIGQTLGRGRTTSSKKRSPQERKGCLGLAMGPASPRPTASSAACPPWCRVRSLATAAGAIGSPKNSTDWIWGMPSSIGALPGCCKIAGLLRARAFIPASAAAAGSNAAYAFLENGRAELQFQNLLAPHQNNTRRRMAAEQVVILAQDTTALSYNTPRADHRAGAHRGRAPPRTRTLLAHAASLSFGSHPLGLRLGARLWAREPVSDTAHRNEQSIDQKESVRWVDAFQTAATIAAQMPQTALVVCGDRESDIIDLYDRATVAPRQFAFLWFAPSMIACSIRGKNSGITCPANPVAATMEVKIPRRTDRPARTAMLELRWAKIPIQPPRVGCKNSWGATELWVLMAKEINPPEGAEILDWVLLTDWKIDSSKMARRLIKWYGLRWGIECWHQTLKDTCGVETRQMKTAEALSRALVLDMIVAWRVLLSCRLGKAHPNLPASVLYTPEELAILEVVQKKRIA